MALSYRISPRPPELGGGHKLTLMENDIEVGGGVFPLTHESQISMGNAQAMSFGEALAAANTWLKSR